MPIRLGDDIDDFCIKCKRLTNHSVVSLVGEQAAKVRCRTCYHDHDFRNGEPLPSKKELKKAALLEEALKNGGAGAAIGDDDEGTAGDGVPDDVSQDGLSEGADGDAPAKGRKTASKKPAAAKKG